RPKLSSGALATTLFATDLLDHRRPLTNRWALTWLTGLWLRVAGCWLLDALTSRCSRDLPCTRRTRARRCWLSHSALTDAPLSNVAGRPRRRPPHRRPRLSRHRRRSRRRLHPPRRRGHRRGPSRPPSHPAAALAAAHSDRHRYSASPTAGIQPRPCSAGTRFYP